MAFHLKRTLIIFAALAVIVQTTKAEGEAPVESNENDDSSSEETVEYSNESRKTRRRSLDSSVEAAPLDDDQTKAALPPIPGLPDPETIRKIAEILTAVGQQVLPLFVSGNSGVSDFVTNRVSHDMKFLKKFKNEVDVLAAALRKNI